MNTQQDLYLTEHDLYRFGNSAGPRLENVRVDRDVPTLLMNGVAFVQPGHHGVSVVTRERAERTPGNGWAWLIPKGTHLEPGLTIVKDSENHYLISPGTLMPLDEFKGLLAKLAARCKRLWKQELVKS